MTRASNEAEFPGISVVAGGRESWIHNPDSCKIESVRVEDGALCIRSSAGGYDRGIAMELKIDLAFLVNKLPEVYQSREEKNENENKHKERNLVERKTQISETWLDVGIEMLPITEKQQKTLNSLELLTVWDVCRQTREDVSNLPGFGYETLRKINFWLDRRGLSFDYSRY